MPSEEEEKQFLQGMHDLEEFAKLFSKKYPKLFKNGCCGMKTHASTFDVLLEIKERT